MLLGQRDNLLIRTWQEAAAGYTAVWATENTRAALWDAMKRRETYATSGPGITVRFFGGFEFTAEDANTRNAAIVGYSKGVAMGGDLKGQIGLPARASAIRDLRA